VCALENPSARSRCHLPLRFRHVEPFPQSTFAFLAHSSPALTLISVQDRVDTTLCPRQDPVRLSQIKRAQIAQLIDRLLPNRPKLSFLVRGETQAGLPSVHRQLEPESRVALALHLMFNDPDRDQTSRNGPGRKDGRQ